MRGAFRVRVREAGQPAMEQAAAVAGEPRRRGVAAAGPGPGLVRFQCPVSLVLEADPRADRR